MFRLTPLITSSIVAVAVFIAASQLIGFVRHHYKLLNPLGLNEERFWAFVDDQKLSAGYFNLLRGPVLNKYVATAGLAPSMTALRITKLKKALLLAVSILGILWAIIFREFYLGVGCLLLVYIAPDYYLSKLSSRRKIQAARTLPQIIDLLVLQSGVGLNLEASFKNLAKSQKGMWGKEFSKVSFEIECGLSTTEVLARLAHRFNLDDLNRFAVAVKQSKVLGASLTETLAIQAETLRTRRKQLAEEKAKLAALKISFPLVVFIFPALLIIYITPAIIRVLQLG